MDIRLDGKVALITGGSDGLGKAMAMKFADAGANVAILARRADVLEAARAEIDGAGPGKAHCYSCDLLDAVATADAFAAAERDLDGIDILVNNAGTSRAAPFVDITDDDWQADFELKLFAAIRLCRLALPKMAARRREANSREPHSPYVEAKNGDAANAAEPVGTAAGATTS